MTLQNSNGFYSVQEQEAATGTSSPVEGDMVQMIIYNLTARRGWMNCVFIFQKEEIRGKTCRENKELR